MREVRSGGHPREAHSRRHCDGATHSHGRSQAARGGRGAARRAGGGGGGGGGAAVQLREEAPQHHGVLRVAAGAAVVVLAHLGTRPRAGVGQSLVTGVLGVSRRSPAVLWDATSCRNAAPLSLSHGKASAHYGRRFTL
jgi:hypothetical protein